MSWRGLSRTEDSWETVTAQHQDVPVLVKIYCLLYQADRLVVNMVQSMSINIPEGNVASQLAVRTIPVQAREPSETLALNNIKEAEQQRG